MEWLRVLNDRLSRRDPVIGEGGGGWGKGCNGLSSYPAMGTSVGTYLQGYCREFCNRFFKTFVELLIRVFVLSHLFLFCRKDDRQGLRFTLTKGFSSKHRFSNLLR